MKLINKYILPLLGIASLYACTPDDEDMGLGEIPEATFTVEKADEPNTFTLINTTPGSFITYWNYGSGFAPGNQTESAYYADKGTYKIQMVAVTEAGADTTDVQEVEVTQDDPNFFNFLEGSEMGADAFDYWTKILIAANSNVDWALKDGKMVASGTEGGHAAIYQAVQVEAGKQYTFSADVSGEGATDTWLEVYFGKEEPKAGNDYGDGGNRIALNTWNGCGNSPFEGDLAYLGCAGSLVGKRGQVTFDESGTIYVLIKTGTNKDLGEGGISIDNVRLRAYK